MIRVLEIVTCARKWMGAVPFHEAVPAPERVRKRRFEVTQAGES
jgi:hypothetical protein